MTQEDEVMPRDEISSYITSHFSGVDTTTYPPDQTPTAWFFSLDAEKHWPNFATIVTTDEHDTEPNSNLTARGAYRLNLGVSRPTFESLIDPSRDYDYTAMDVPAASNLRETALDRHRQPDSPDVRRTARHTHPRGVRAPGRAAQACANLTRMGDIDG